MIKKENTVWNYTIYILSIAYSFFIIYSITELDYFNFLLFWLGGTVFITIAYPSSIPAIETSIFILPWYFFPETGQIFITLPLITSIILFTGYKGQSRLAPLIVILWFILANKTSPADWNPVQYFILITVLITLFIYIKNHLKSLGTFKKADVISCTYSSNTGHYTKHFVEGLKKAGIEVKEHHFYYYPEFKCNPEGDALVISFPVYGWKTPWHFCDYIKKSLPPGKGKPAFILYSAAGGPENAGIFAYILLTIKGYRVVGRSWGLYPINVATFRILPGKIHRYFDKLLPWNDQIEEVSRYGYEFGRGNLTGYPFIFWPFLLIIIGYLFDNKWINIGLYRNYVWKRRCTKCGICVKSCPIKRLYMDENGYPRPKGTCTLCLSCINLCPTNAMQMFCLSEYGRPYRPNWPGLIKK